jgi:YVTN family beta-propeller protein
MIQVISKVLPSGSVPVDRLCRTVIGLALEAAFSDVTPDGKTVFVTSSGPGIVATIDVKTRTKEPTDISVGLRPSQVAVTPDGKTAFVTHELSNTVSTFDVKARTKRGPDIPVGTTPNEVAIAPCRRVTGTG